MVPRQAQDQLLHLHSHLSCYRPVLGHLSSTCAVQAQGQGQVWVSCRHRPVQNHQEKYHFEVALVLREILFKSSLLLNSEAWVNLKEQDIRKLEQVDEILHSIFQKL